jgi:glucosamine--fructose-6-phosphate aminotransferase (isomerizing)
MNKESLLGKRNLVTRPVVLALALRPMTALAETIAEQGELLEAVLSINLDAAAERIEPARRVWLVGTGTSQHAAELGGWLLAGTDREVQWRSSASFCFEEPELGAQDAVVIISHTAQTAFARQARQRALDAGTRLVSITGHGRGWPEAVETVPAERSETYTASYLSALVVLARLSLAVARPGFDERQLSELPRRVRAAAAESGTLDTPPERLVVLAGVGPGAVTAREGALKLREAARLPAEGYEAEYLLHGSAVPLRAGDALVALAPTEDRFGLLASLGAAAAAEGLRVASVSEPPGIDPVLSQIPLTVRLQRLACELADAQGVDPDLVIRSAWAVDALWQAGAPPTA